MAKLFFDEQKSTDEYVRSQANGYRLLKDDLFKGRITFGESKMLVLSRYGEPVFCKEKGSAECCLYRLPLDFSSTDQTYLYFDNAGRLYSWHHDGGKGCGDI